MHSVYKLIGIQAVIALIVTAVLFIFFGSVAAYSAIVAGFICVLCNLFFAKMIFRYRGAQQVKQFIMRYMLAEVAKIILIVVFMFIALKFLHIKAMPFLLTFVILQLIMSFMPAVIKK